MCYHLTRKPISVVKNVLHRNCSDLQMPKEFKVTPTNESTWCDYPPFGKFCFFFVIDSLLFLLSFRGNSFRGHYLALKSTFKIISQRVTIFFLCYIETVIQILLSFFSIDADVFQVPTNHLGKIISHLN